MNHFSEYSDSFGMINKILQNKKIKKWLSRKNVKGEFGIRYFRDGMDYTRYLIFTHPPKINKRSVCITATTLFTAIVERYKGISYFTKRDKIKEGKLINEKVVRDEFPQYFWKKIIVVETR